MLPERYADKLTEVHLDHMWQSHLNLFTEKKRKAARLFMIFFLSRLNVRASK
jgi:hypothetical protein